MRQGGGRTSTKTARKPAREDLQMACLPASQTAPLPHPHPLTCCISLGPVPWSSGPCTWPSESSSGGVSTRSRLSTLRRPRGVLAKGRLSVKGVGPAEGTWRDRVECTINKQELEQGEQWAARVGSRCCCWHQRQQRPGAAPSPRNTGTATETTHPLPCSRRRGRRAASRRCRATLSRWPAPGRQRGVMGQESGSDGEGSRSGGAGSGVWPGGWTGRKAELGCLTRASRQGVWGQHSSRRHPPTSLTTPLTRCTPAFTRLRAAYLHHQQ